MNTLLISYDLGGPETSGSYKDLISKIKSYPDYVKALESFWFVKTPLTASEVRDQLNPYLDANDQLFVFNVTNSAWAAHKASTATNWLKSR